MSPTEKLYLLAAAYVVGLPVFFALICHWEKEVTWGHVVGGLTVGWAMPYLLAAIMIVLSPVVICEWLGPKIATRWPSIYAWSISAPSWSCRVAFRCKR